jgi:predicted helicase
MSQADIEKLKLVRDFEGLVEYLTYELDWPIEADNADDATFGYTPEELGIESGHAAKIKTIKQIRPLTDNQPYGVFYIEFDPKKLPVVVLRRILRAFVTSKREKSDGGATWGTEDLLFITTLGEIDERTTSVARFSQTGEGLPEIRAISWDETDTYFHYEQNILDLDKLRWPSHDGDADAWREQWKSAFPLKHREVITTSQRLATEMAQLARRIRDQIKLVHQYETRDGPLHSLYENFQSVLIHDLTIDDFADMYAQTVAYGLFSASCTQEGEFSVKDVPAMVPNTNPFLKKLFEECTRIEESSIDTIDLEELGVLELVEMLEASNIEAVLQDFGKQKQGEDPVIHFYELFLREYDPEKKVKRGVFYTPDPVVSFIVRSVDYLLRTEFDCPDGLADTSTDDTEQVHKVQILDPATGTGTFLKYVIEEIKKTFDEKHKGLGEEELRDKWNEYVPKHLLPRVFGFELMMAPYTVAHLKLGLELKETGYDFQSEERLGIYLTNTLEGTHKGAGRLDAYYNWLAEEVSKANMVKAKPILAIIGNPPYSGISENMGNWIKELIEDYKYVDGEHFGERKHWLQDDYVKFIRFGQWKIDRTGEGVLGFITNHSYLDNPTFRGMRQSLMNSFNEIYLLDLHGNSLKEKGCPDGSKDENVFDIRQGVTIGLFVKKREQNGVARVYYAERWGLREDKYKWLLRSDITTTEWEELKPNSPFYFFVPREETGREDYEKYWKVTDVFPIKRTGIVTARDKFVIDFDMQALRRRMEMFRDLSLSDEFIGQSFNLKENYMWRVKKARGDLSKVLNWEDNFTKILYRPFDIRDIYFHDSVVWRTRKEVMQHMMAGENLGLMTCRQIASGVWQHSLVCAGIVDDSLVSNKTRERGYLFPLYLYSNSRKKKLLNSKNSTTKTLNLNQNLIESLTDSYSTKPTPEEIFYYIYAVFHSNTYRIKYAEFLKIDFPRVPFTSDYDLFKTLSRLGSELVSLHLMESPKLDDLITEFRGGGDNVVAAIGKNSYKDGKLKINKTQYFEGMPEEVYNFHIGGYQVCQKWLKDRKERALSEEDILHYQKIVVALNETIRIMKEIDEAIDGHGGWPIR